MDYNDHKELFKGSGTECYEWIAKPYMVQCWGYKNDTLIFFVTA